MTLVTDPTDTTDTLTNDVRTVNQRIAAGLGDPNGSYQLLVGARICAALHIDPELRGQVVPAPDYSAATLTWLRDTAASGDGSAVHATEILATLPAPN